MHWLLLTGESIFLGMVHHFCLMFFFFIFSICSPNSWAYSSGGGVDSFVLVPVGCF